LFSCDHENVTPEAKPNTLITVNTNLSELYFGKRFYFVTNLDGELLAYKQLENQEINVLYTENSIIPDKFNVHRLYVSNDNEIRFLESFFHTNQTSFTHKSVCEDVLESIGNCTINISGPTFTSYLISYPGGSVYAYSANEIYTINRNIETHLYDGHNFLFTFLQKDQQYYYKYFLDLNPNEIYNFELDPNTMNTNYNLKVLNAPESMFFLDQCNIQSVILGGLCYPSVCRLYSEISNDSIQLSIFVTPIGLEKYYKCRFHLLVEDDKEYTYHKLGNLPEFIPTLDFDITNSNLDFNNISLTTNGSFDVIIGNYRTESNSKSWKFYSDNPDFIKFPDIPAEITDQYPTLTSSTYFGTSTVEGYISLNEYNEIENYSDFMSDFELNRYLGENSALQKLTVRNY
jgi:hypothetical protein